MELYETSVGVLGKIGVWTDLVGPSLVLLFAVMVFVDACTSLVFLAAGTDPVASPLHPASHCSMTILSSIVLGQLLASLADDDCGNCDGGAFPGEASVMLFAYLLMGMGEWPTRLWVCGVLSFSSSMIRRMSRH